MDTNKMREQFEAAYAALSTTRNGRFYPAVLTRSDDGDYVIPSVQSAWWAWQASREAVVVKLPGVEVDMIDQAGGEQEVRYYPQRALVAAIEAQGLKVAP